jgi:response regulator RpfG family c-di-GMP phosphodiesterase
MPGMNGRQLADRLKLIRPETAVLFTSGYPKDVITQRGVLDPGVGYISKPYSEETIAAKVRETLRR